MTFRELVRIMLDADLQAIGQSPIGEGVRILKDKFGDWHQWHTGVTAVLQNNGSRVD